ncbi:MAG: aldo/keto reductase [Planctomycetota bacterium]|jgi:aryl-alcohol dehydrogenase-like predicted oxidoreductase
MMNLELDSYRPFGRTGLMVSPLGFGGAPIGVLDTEAERAARVLNLLLDAGVNVIDTAACYFGSEKLIGRAIGHRRDEFVLISKCGHADAGETGPRDFRPDVIAANIDESLRRLGTDYLDVVLLHSCDLQTLKGGDALDAVVAAREAGKVRHVGYSGDNDVAAHAAGLDEVEVIQTSVSICDQVNIDVVLPPTRSRGVAVMAKRPVANAAWKSIDDQYERYRDYAQPYHERFAAMGLALDALDLDGDPDWPAVALRFTLSIPGVHTAIIGTTNPEHVTANIGAAAKGPLPPTAVQTMRDAFRRADPDGAWPGLI